MEDSSYIRIKPITETQANIYCYFEHLWELREELQNIAYQVHYTLNNPQELVFISNCIGMRDVEIYAIFGEEGKFLGDVIVHGFSSTHDLIKYLCDLASSIAKEEEKYRPFGIIQ